MCYWMVVLPWLLDFLWGMWGASYYHSIGYVQDDETAESVSRTLEYAYDDWCVAQMAKTLGENGRLCPFDMI